MVNLVPSLHILLQPPQPPLSLLQNFIVLANCKPHIILRQVRIRMGVKLGWRNRRHAHLLDQKPRQLKIPRSAGDVFGEGIVSRHLDFFHINEHEVAAFGLGVGQIELGPDLIEAVHLGLHVGNGFVPEALRLGLLEAHGAGFLERRDGRIADARVGCRDVFDEVGGAHEPACERGEKNKSQ